MKLIEVVPNKKVVWLVLDNHFNFTEDQSEWRASARPAKYKNSILPMKKAT